MLTIDDYQIDIQQAFYENDQTVIYRCEKTQTKEKYLCKILPIENTFPDSLNELEVLKIIQKEQHMNIVKIYEIKCKFGFAYVFMESFNQNLEQHLQSRESMNSEDVCQIISQILNGYKQLRKLKIVLRNLNLSSIYMNIVQGQFLFKITDFTFSHFLDQKINSKAQSLDFAPEILNMNNIQNYNEQCDVYSLGILIYRLFFQGSFPLQIKDLDSLKNFHQTIKNIPFVCPRNNLLSNDFIQMIQNMIVYDPQKRYSWEQLDLAPKLQQKFIIWKDKYFIDLSAVYGQGAQGLILLAEDLQKKQTVLAKKVNTQSTSGEREKQIYQNLIGHKNQNVIKVLDICEPYKSQFCYLILEKGEFNLQKYFEQKQNFKKEEIIDFAQQIIDGYCFLKNKNIIHRDIKLENIVIVFDSIKKPIYKIIDFGAGKILSQSNMPWTKAGTPLFQAPEVYRGGSEYDHTCDIFSFGFIFYYIVFKGYPCNARNELELKKWHEQIKFNPLKCPIYEEPEISKLIEKMLLYDSQKRITWDELQNHPLIVANRRQIHKENKTVIQQQQAQRVLQQSNENQLFAQQSSQQQQEQQQQQSKNTLNVQQQQEILPKKIKIVEVQYNLYENLDDLSKVHMPSEFGMPTEQNKNQNINLQQSNKQIQALNIQKNNLPNEISLAEYIYQIIQLTRKFIDTVEDFLNKVQEFPYWYELTFLTVFALRFLISCFMTLDQILDNKTIQLNGFSFKTDRTQVENLNINSQEILNYIKEKDQKSKIQIGQISSDFLVKKQFLNLKQQMDLEAKKKTEISLQIYFTHYYFKLYYLTFRNEIKQITEIPLLLKFFLEKLSNLFDDFPVRNPLLYKLNDIYFKIIQNQFMENYLKNHWV